MKLLESFELGYAAEPNSGCWLWTRSLNNMGYGKFCGVLTGKWMLAHRFSYELHRGPIPAGKVLDHKCRTPSCVNPDHLEPVTFAENVRRGGIRERTGACRFGHPVSKRTPRGHLRCTTCEANYQRNRRRAALQKHVRP